MLQNNKFGLIMLSLLASSCFAIIAPFSVATADAGLIPAYTVLFRYMVLIICATPFIYIYTRKYFKFTRSQFWLIILQGVAGGILNLSYLGALSYIPLSLAVIIFFTFPLITLIVSPFIFGGRLTLYKIVVFICAFLGLLFVVGPELSTLNPIGILLALIGALTAVTQLLCMSKLIKEVKPMALLYSVHVIAMIFTILIISGFYFAGEIDFPPPITFDIGINFMGVVLSYILAFGLFSYVTQYLDPSTISLFSNIEPIVTIAVAILLFSEILQINQVFGISIVLVSLIAGSLAKS